MTTYNNTHIPYGNTKTSNPKPEELDIANTVEYYLYDISLLTLIYMGLSLLNNITKIEQHVPKHSLLNKQGIEKRRVEHTTKLNADQKKLRKLFLYGSFITKTATWLKAPYIFSLYNRLHGFTRPEIGFLLIVENITSLVFGPIIGNLADTFGNKNFCILHGLLVSLHACLRLTGIKNVGYIAQFISGLCSCIFDVAYESWFINESSLLFNNNEKSLKESFRSEVLSKQVQIDGLISIFITGIGTILNINFGIKAPFIASVFVSTLSSVFVFFFWKESSKEDFEKHDRLNAESEIRLRNE
jgi:hypothetical protein